MLTLVIDTGGPIDGMVLNAASVTSPTLDPNLTNNVTLLLVPESQILGDVNGDGLVDFKDKKIVKDCSKSKGRDNPQCDTADVNGDGVVDGRDSAIVAERKTSTSKKPSTVTFEEHENEELTDFGLLFEYQVLDLIKAAFNKTGLWPFSDSRRARYPLG
jgi:hypothetical protein